MDEWEHQRSIQDRSDEYSSLELGFSTFFLNRTNHSGIIKGGVIGGRNQDGPFKLDARYTKTNLINRIQRIARYGNRISIYRMDAAEFIQQVLPNLPKLALIYLDPPYYIKGQGLYENFYEHKDHLLISQLLKNIQQHWIVSYDNTEQILEMYKGYRKIAYNLSYSAGNRYKGSEVMFFSDHLSVPTIKTPVSVSKKQISKSLTLQLNLPS
jgi:DNA adenine methylase